MNVATVCTGIGAPEVAFEQEELGWIYQWFAEIEKFPSLVLRHHYPNTPNLGDMTKLKGNPIYEQSIIDLLIGGTPCQSFSVAGLRAGLADERGNMALEYCRILIYKRPPWFVWENVPGVLSIEGGEDFACILSAFTGKDIKPEGLGNSGIIAGDLYSVAWRILDAQYFGVPQRRRRIFVVGHLGNDWRPPAAVLFEPESLRGYSPPSGKEGAEITGTLTPGAHPGSYNGPAAYTGHLVAGALSARGVGTCGADDNQAQANHLIMAHGQGNAEVVRDGSPSLTCNHESPIIFGWQNSAAQGDSASDSISPTLDKSKVPACYTLHGSQANEVASETTLTATLRSRAPGQIENSTTNVVLQQAIRRLTPLECERLQGFPDHYTKVPGYEGWRAGAKHETPEYCEANGLVYKITKKGRVRVRDADGPRYKAIGNSMAVPVMRWLGRRIDHVDKIIKSKA